MIDDVAPLLVLQARAEARALLYADGEFNLEQAMQPLMQYALDTGIVHKVGAEGAVAIIKRAFVEFAGLSEDAEL